MKTVGYDPDRGHTVMWKVGAIILGAAIVALMVVTAGCSTPPEATEAVDVTQAGALAIEDDYQRFVLAAATEMERMGTVILNYEINDRIEAETRVTGDGKLTPAQAMSIVVFARDAQKAITDAKAEKVQEVKDSPNLDIITRMNKALRRHLQGDQAATREIDRLIGEASVIFEKKKETP